MDSETHLSERADARANRARVIEAARAAFCERGLAAEMKELAERAEVGVGTIYRNFPGGKEDLILAILRDLLATSLAEVGAAEAMADPVEGIHFLLRCELARVEQYGWLFEALLSGQIPPRCRAGIREDLEAHEFGRRFERLVSRALAEGRLRADIDAQLAAALLSGATSPMNRFALPDRSPQELADAIIETFLRGTALAPKNPVVDPKGEAAKARP